jgi:hypothetical protein
MSWKKESVMSETPSWETVREAIRLIKEDWPDAESWAEIGAVEELVPADPALLGTSVPEDARGAVLNLVGRIAIIPIPRPSGKCDELSRWVGINLNA